MRPSIRHHWPKLFRPDWPEAVTPLPSGGCCSVFGDWNRTNTSMASLCDFGLFLVVEFKSGNQLVTVPHSSCRVPCPRNMAPRARARQNGTPPQLHAHSVLFLLRWVFPRALALANWYIKLLVSSHHLQPTSTATNRQLPFLP